MNSSIWFFATTLTVAACSATDNATPPDLSAGGTASSDTTASGGVAAVGGKSAAGGVKAIGGARATGGRFMMMGGRPRA